jgi:hypothetical protein
MRGIGVMCLCALVAGTTGRVQRPSRALAQFRTGVEAVVIDVRVLDGRGEPVGGLTAQDFEVLEDGVRQDIRAFTPVRIPVLGRRSLAHSEPDVQTNRAPFEGRVFAFVLDDRGLAGIEDETIEVEGLPDDATRASEVGVPAFLDALRRAQDSLRVLAEETGGFAIVNTNDLAGGLDRLIREHSEYYVLGYEPANARQDGRFRRIEVRVRRPGVHAVARRGYYGRKPDEAPPGSAAAGARAIRAVIDSPLPLSGLPLDSTVALFRGTGNAASAVVTVEIGPAFILTERDGLHHGRVDVSIVAVGSRPRSIAASISGCGRRRARR